jgi:hypothetical protein
MSFENPLFTYERDLDPIDLRKVWEVLQEGAVGDGLLVSQGAGLTIDVAAGVGFIEGDTVADQGLYRVFNDATLNSSAFPQGGIAAADATKPRLDQIVVEIKDNEYDASGDYAAIPRVLTGVATTGATLDNRNGAAALPDSTILLADVLVPAASPSIDAEDVRDRRADAFGAFTVDLMDAIGVVELALAAHLADATPHGIDLGLLPSSDEKDALAGSDGSPSAANPYVTDSDARLSGEIPEAIIDAKGDLIVGDAADSAARLPVGSDDEVLIADASEPKGVRWGSAAAAGGAVPETLIDAKGDLIVGTAADTPARLPVGTNGQVPVADSSEAAGIRWDTPAGTGDALKAETKGCVVHGATAGEARPAGYASIEWIGSVEPTNALDDDTWIDTSA